MSHNSHDIPCQVKKKVWVKKHQVKQERESRMVQIVLFKSRNGTHVRDTGLNEGPISLSHR